MFRSVWNSFVTGMLVVISAVAIDGYLSSAEAAEAASFARAVRRASESIHVEELKKHAEILADDTMEGREAGKPGGRSAATYIMRSLRKSGLEPTGENGTFFQPFNAGCRNILAKIPATTNRWPREVIIVCAHYDHVGYGSKRNSNGIVGSIHNGADDNASGVATVLEVAEAMQQFEGKLDRTILFVFWDGEEKGLWGSKHWLKKPTVALKDVRMMINVDMVGRLREKLSIYGSRSMPGMRFDWSKANNVSGLSLHFPWEILDNSDHYPFLKQGIPISMVHTGLHDDYHTPSDDAHRLNYDGIHQATKLILNFAVDAANREAYPSFRWSSIYENEANRKAHERPFKVPAPKLGISLSGSGEGLKIESVVVGSKAEKFGLKPGFRIVAVNGESLNSIADFRQVLAASYEPFKIIVDDKGVSKAIVVDLGRKKPRIGVAWRTDKAEPNSVMVSNVVADTPAERGGVERLDRIYMLNGVKVEGSNHFRKLTSNVDGKVELLVERDGQLKALELTVSPVDAD